MKKLMLLAKGGNAEASWGRCTSSSGVPFQMLMQYCCVSEDAVHGIGAQSGAQTSDLEILTGSE